MFQSEKSENEDGKKDDKEDNSEKLKKGQTTLKWACISAIQHLFKGWLIVLQNIEFIVEMNYAVNFAQITTVMISSFMQMIFSVPFGDREEVGVFASFHFTYLLVFQFF